MQPNATLVARYVQQRATSLVRIGNPMEQYPLPCKVVQHCATGMSREIGVIAGLLSRLPIWRLVVRPDRPFGEAPASLLVREPSLNARGLKPA
eukprot:scaffold67648_cov17-Tisochrysis_lutea.AAC.4